jgi:glutathione peroxidase
MRLHHSNKSPGASGPRVFTLLRNTIHAAFIAVMQLFLTYTISHADSIPAASAAVSGSITHSETGSAVTTSSCSPLLDFEKRPLHGGDPVHLCQAFKGKVVLVVNTASRCMYTPQYETLEKLYQDYRDDGLVVAGFPSNDFGAQEPGSSEKILDFCKVNYGVEFPMFEKLHASSDKADPFYKALAEAAGGQFPQWNFHKYLIGRDGNLIRSYRSGVEPDSEELLSAIRKAL